MKYNISSMAVLYMTSLFFLSPASAEELTSYAFVNDDGTLRMMSEDLK